MAVAGIHERPVFHFGVQVGVPGNFLDNLVHVAFERRRHAALAPAFDIPADSIELAVRFGRARPACHSLLRFGIFPRASRDKCVIELVETFGQFRDTAIGLHHHAHGKQGRIAISRFCDVHVLELFKFARNSERRQNFGLGLFLRVVKVHALRGHQAHHASIFHVGEQVHVHAVAVRKPCHRAKSKLVRSPLARQFVQVIARRLEYGARCRQSKFREIEFAPAVRNRALGNLARRFESLAVDALHLHGRSLDKRALLEHARYVGDNARIFCNAARNLAVATTHNYKRQNGQRQQQDRQYATDTLKQFSFHHPSSPFSNSPCP